MLGIAYNHPSDTRSRCKIAQTKKIMHCQSVSWHPDTAPGGRVSRTSVRDSNAAEPVGVRGGGIEAHTQTQLTQGEEEENIESTSRVTKGPTPGAGGNREEH